MYFFKLFLLFQKSSSLIYIKKKQGSLKKGTDWEDKYISLYAGSPKKNDTTKLILKFIPKLYFKQKQTRT